MRHRPRAAARPSQGLTLVEVLIGVALIGILLALSGPRLREMVVSQRLKGVHAQLMSDLQFARSEAARRNRPVRIDWSSNDAASCYVLSTPVDAPASQPCDCTAQEGACGSGRTPIRTVAIERSLGVVVSPADPARSALQIDASRGSVTPAGFAVDVAAPLSETTIRTTVSGAGQPGACALHGAVPMVPACP